MAMQALNRTVGLLVLWTVAAAVLTGCWDRLEIEERAVVLALSIDKASEEDVQQHSEITYLEGSFPPPQTGFIKLTAQIAVPGRIPLGPGEGGSGGTVTEKPVWILNVIGYTVNDAIQSLQQELADRIFFGHLRVVVISEEVAREGLGNVNDYFRRNPQVRRLTWMLISKGEASELMDASPELERVPALYLLAMMDHAVDLGKYPNEFLGKFWTKLSNKGSDGFLPYVAIKGNDNVQLTGLAYFREEKMVGKTEPLEIANYMAITGVPTGGYSALTPFPDLAHPVMFRASHRKTQIKTKIKNGQPEFTIDIALEGNLDEKEQEHFVFFDHQSIIVDFQQEVAKRAKASYEQFIEKMQKEESDIFSFGEYIRAKHPTYWSQSVQTPDQWRKIYREAKFNVNVTVKIRLIGMKAR